MNEPTNDEIMDLDKGYQEWSETIEKQNQEQQDLVMVEYDTYEEFINDLLIPNSKLIKKLNQIGEQ